VRLRAGEVGFRNRGFLTQIKDFLGGAGILDIDASPETICRLVSAGEFQFFSATLSFFEF
jgi:hypothetical protein